LLVQIRHLKKTINSTEQNKTKQTRSCVNVKYTHIMLINTNCIERKL